MFRRDHLPPVQRLFVCVTCEVSWVGNSSRCWSCEKRRGEIPVALAATVQRTIELTSARSRSER